MRGARPAAAVPHNHTAPQLTPIGPGLNGPQPRAAIPHHATPRLIVTRPMSEMPAASRNHAGPPLTVPGHGMTESGPEVVARHHYRAVPLIATESSMRGSGPEAAV